MYSTAPSANSAILYHWEDNAKVELAWSQVDRRLVGTFIDSGRIMFSVQTANIESLRFFQTIFGEFGVDINTKAGVRHRFVAASLGSPLGWAWYSIAFVVFSFAPLEKSTGLTELCSFLRLNHVRVTRSHAAMLLVLAITGGAILASLVVGW